MYAKLAKFGLHHVGNPSLVFNETDEFATTVDEIINGDVQDNGSRLTYIFIEI